MEKMYLPNYDLKRLIDGIISVLGLEQSTTEYNNHLKQLRKYFRCNETHPYIAYNDKIKAYIKRYFLPNLVKNYFIINELAHSGLLSNCSTIYDIGSGPGTFTFAYTMYMKQYPNLLSKNINITMIDTVSGFLELFQEIWSDFHHHNVEVQLINKAIEENINYKYNRPQLCIFSNSLSELLRQGIINLNYLLNLLFKQKPITAIVDYDYEQSRQYLRTFSEKISTQYINLKLGSEPYTFEGFQSVNLGKVRDFFSDYFLPLELQKGKIEFIKSIWIHKNIEHFSNTSIVSRIVEGYKRAWENHDINIIRCLFTEDAKYSEKPGIAPLNGLDQICSYWQENANKQANVQFHPKSIELHGDKIITNWTCTFYRKDLLKWIILDGIFYAQLRDKKIYDFSENFTKKIIK